MKGFNRIVAMAALGASLAGTASIASAQMYGQSYGNQAPAIFYGSEQLVFSGAEQPFTRNGTVLVPFRETADRIRASVGRSRSGEEIWVVKDRNRVDYRVGRMEYRFNNRILRLSTSSAERRDILFVPIELFRELTDRRLVVRYNDWRDRDDRRDRDRDRDRDWDRDRDRDWDRGDRADNVFWYRDRRLTFSDREEPFRSGRIWFVPLRVFASKIGARVERPDDRPRVVVTLGRNRVVYNPGDRWYRINDRREGLDDSSRERDGVLYVPVEIFQSLAGRDLEIGRRR